MPSPAPGQPPCLGWVLPPGLAPDEVLLEEDASTPPEVPVRAATWSALAKLLLAAFDDVDGEVLPGNERLVRVVFSTHGWFAPARALAAQLCALHRAAHHACADCTAECAGARTQARVCHAFRFWIAQFPLQFPPEGELSARLREFRATLPPAQARLVDPAQAPPCDWLRNGSLRAQPGHAQQVTLVLDQLEPMQLAAHITFLEHKLIRRIAPDDYRRYATAGGALGDSPRLQQSVALFNGLTRWIQCTILSRSTPQQRADVIDKFVAVAQKLLELQNFNSLMAVVGSVDHSVIARLSRTMACLSPRTRRSLSELTELLASANNFGNYRRALAAAPGFKIPILGLHLKDLTCLHVALPDSVGSGLLNVRKMAQLSVVFLELDQLQTSAPPAQTNADLVNMLRLSLDLASSDDEIYDLSLTREPRTCNSPQSSPTQSVVFAEWAAGPSPPPHPATLEKHVSAMVQAVFKTYDTDGDGCISHREFDAVAGNFPFIAPFGTLDANHDGVISQQEMKRYFIEANCHALKSGFKHDFHETTYFKPTFCGHCTGLLWGLIRQGYKCRDCCVNAHKHCKDLLVLECRLGAGAHASADGSSHSMTARRKFRQKKKSSASESGEPPGAGQDRVGGSLPNSPKVASPRRKVSEMSGTNGAGRNDLIAAHKAAAGQGKPQSTNGSTPPPL